MTRALAAYYVGVSPTTFDARVRDGIYPNPHSDGRYDRVALDLAVDRLSGFDDVDATDAVAHPEDWTERFAVR